MPTATVTAINELLSTREALQSAIFFSIAGITGNSKRNLTPAGFACIIACFVNDRNWHLRRALGALALIAVFDASGDPMDHMMMGALGSYPVTREASGTSWQPDSSTHGGVHIMEGGGMLMGHTLLNGVYD